MVEVYIVLITLLSLSTEVRMLFGILKKLDTTKMIKDIIIVPLSYLNFPPKHLTDLLLVKSCFSLQSNEKCFLPFAPGASLSLFPCPNAASLRSPWQALSCCYNSFCSARRG